MLRLLPDRVAGRWKCRRVERTHCDSTDRRVAIPFPIKGGTATWAKMKSNAVAAVGVALVDLPVAVEPHSLFRTCRTEMESHVGPTLARVAVAQVHPIWFACGNHFEASRNGILRFVT